MASNTSVVSGNLTYCGEDLTWFANWYAKLHPYTSLLVCVFGVLANTLNMIVLTRKELVSATNAILTGLAFADNVVMIVCLPFIVHQNFIAQSEKFTYPWALLRMVYIILTTLFHTISVYLTVTLAVWRYLSVAHPLYSRNHCTLRRAKLAIASAYVVSPVLCLPNYFTFTTIQRNGSYYLHPTRFAIDNNLISINFWTYGVVGKIIPCVALTVLSWQLIRALASARKRKEALQGRGVLGEGERHATDRTTRMLLAVLFLFLITEFPHGIVSMLGGILGDEFLQTCYAPLGNIFDFCALINCSINFILYCAMSRQFRQTFLKLFRPQRMLGSARLSGSATTATTAITATC